MEAKKNINNEIEKLLDAYRYQPKPELNPYFNSRLKARLEQEQSLSNYSLKMIKVRVLAVMFFVVINALSIFSYVHSQNKLLEEEALSTLETQYAVEATNIYAYSFEN